MNEKVYVLCSKYSESCQQFMSIVSQFGIDIIYPIYIDSQEARTIILSSPLKIKSVPCILGTVNGFFATYEGKDAFDWLNEISKNYIETPSPEEEIVPAENMNALAENKITDSKTIAERMREERERDDKFLHDERRMTKERSDQR